MSEYVTVSRAKIMELFDALDTIEGGMNAAVEDAASALATEVDATPPQPEANIPWTGDCDCGADPYKDGTPCRADHLPDCPAAAPQPEASAQPAPSGDVVEVVADALHEAEGNGGDDAEPLYTRMARAALSAARPIIERETVERCAKAIEEVQDGDIFDVVAAVRALLDSKDAPDGR